MMFARAKSHSLRPGSLPQIQPANNVFFVRALAEDVAGQPASQTLESTNPGMVANQPHVAKV